MALKARGTKKFKANIKFLEDNSVKEVSCRLPRLLDYHRGEAGNVVEDRLMLLSNIIENFEKPVQVALEDNSVINVYSFRQLLEYDVEMDYDDIWDKMNKASEEAQADKEKLVKKSKSDGGSEVKATNREQG